MKKVQHFKKRKRFKSSFLKSDYFMISLLKKLHICHRRHFSPIFWYSIEQNNKSINWEEKEIHYGNNL